jgi:hypothetical protein
VVEALGEDGIEKFSGSFGEVLGPSVPFVYRDGGLNFLNGVVGDEAGRSSSRRMSVRLDVCVHHGTEPTWVVS